MSVVVVLVGVFCVGATLVDLHTGRRIREVLDQYPGQFDHLVW